MMRQAWQILSLLAMGFLLSRCSSQSADISISDAWARPGFAGANSAVYFEIENKSEQDDALLSAQATVAELVELHESKIDSSGMMKMQKQDRVNAPENKRVAFQPGGLHVMLINLTQDLKVGDRFKLSLTFEKAGQIEVEVEVRQP